MNRRTLLGAVALTALATAIPGLMRPALAETPATAPEVADLVIGNPDAKVTVVEYASYTCPHCATFHARVFKDLKANYIDTGKVRFIYREVYFDRYGLWAAMVARCGGEMRYFGIQDMLYAEQADWSGAGGAVDVVAALRKIGLKAGLTNEALDACMQDGAMAEAMVAKFQKDSAADGIDSTPSFVINGKKHGNMTYADLSKLLDGLLAG
ncbi:Protein-disulfide isomerase [Gemmobacter megaterium]|uniref:Protein-disulfide isomerase n=1 Tax=Gemmobacter megaterium TaxID=1086013 RepID=A0A1N7LXT2_9RHOB|nr:DsbA family protein [Gemmobacter megaterium]GGE10126.1 thiol-disulfide oxidoreductase [Gemmobacter megaterium]SIS78511.1 Protein-disulfide isomerase [Gemmobacter megaterium]